MKQLLESLVEIETEAEHLLLARHQVKPALSFSFVIIIFFSRMFDHFGMADG